MFVNIDTLLNKRSSLVLFSIPLIQRDMCVSRRFCPPLRKIKKAEEQEQEETHEEDTPEQEEQEQEETRTRRNMNKNEERRGITFLNAKKQLAQQICGTFSNFI